MADSIWWTKMLHKDFCAHYCEMSDSEIVADVRRSVASLMMQRSEGSDFGALMVQMAMERIAAKHETAVSNGMQGGRPRKDTTADGDIREDSQAEYDGSAITRNETRAHDALDSPATLSQDAAHRKAADDCKAPTSCTHYDQGTDQVSTDEAMESQALESRRTDGHSLRVGNVARPPVRSPGRNSRCPNSREEFHAFVADNNLHEGLAEEWYAIHEARGWVDENGNPIKNWRGALKNFCIKIEQKRRTA